MKNTASNNLKSQTFELTLAELEQVVNVLIASLSPSVGHVTLKLEETKKRKSCQ
jgi:hypothetical protein